MDSPKIWVSNRSKRECREKLNEIWIKNQTKVGRYVFKQVGKKTGVAVSLSVSIVAYDLGPGVINHVGPEVVTYGHDAIEFSQNLIL